MRPVVAAIRRARPHPRLGSWRTFDAAIASAMRLRNSIWAEAAAHRIRLRRRRGPRLADADGARRGRLARRAGRWRLAAVAGRLVAGPGEPAGVPVPVAALVFPAVHLGAVPVAGVTHRLAVHAHASGPLRRPRLSGRRQLRVLAGAAGPGRGPGRHDGQPDLLCRRDAARIQGGADRARGRDAVRGARAAARLQRAARSRQTRRPARARHAGAALRARVRPQVAARRRAAGRAAGRQRRHPVAGGPGQQLRGREGDAVGAVHAGHRLPVGRDHAAAGAATDVDDDFARGVARRSSSRSFSDVGLPRRRRS